MKKSVFRAVWVFGAVLMVLMSIYVVSAEPTEHLTTQDFILDGTVITGLEDSGWEKLRANGGVLKIPEDLAATKIGDEAFQNCTDIRELILSSKIAEIGNKAFAGTFVAKEPSDRREEDLFEFTVERRSSLETIRWAEPSALSTIGADAFHASGLSGELSLPSGIRYIGGRAFQNCRMTGVSFPDDIRSVGPLCFADNLITNVDLGSLEQLQGTRWREELNQEVPGILSYGMFRNNQIAQLTIPEGRIWAIGSHAFQNNRIEALVIPPNIKNLYRSSFDQNKTLKSLTIAERTGKIQIDRVSFRNAPIEELHGLEYIREVGAGVFLRNSMTRIDIPKIPIIGAFCFAKSPNLEEVTVRQVDYIFDNGMFWDTPLKNVAFVDFDRKPGSVNLADFFKGTKLRSIEVPAWFDGSIVTDSTFENAVGWIDGSTAVALYRKNQDGYLLDNAFSEPEGSSYYVVNPVLLKIRAQDESSASLSLSAVAVKRIRSISGSLVEQQCSVDQKNHIDFKLGDQIEFAVPSLSGYAFQHISAGGGAAVGSGILTATLSPDNVADVTYDDGYKIPYKEYVIVLNYKKETGGGAQGGESGETTTSGTTAETTAETTVTTTTATTVVVTSTSGTTTIAPEASTDAGGEITTTPESDTENQADTTGTTESSSASAEEAASSVPLTTSEPSTTSSALPTTTRTFEFIDIGEEIPLGVRTTAPIDLELVLIEEAVALAGLPNTGSPSFVLYFGIGLVISSVAVALLKRTR